MTADKPAYILVDTKITDPVAYEDYKAAAKPIAEQYGGVYLTRGGKMDIMQAELWNPARIVLVKFPSMAAAHAFLDSPGICAHQINPAGTFRGDIACS